MHKERPLCFICGSMDSFLLDPNKARGVFGWGEIKCMFEKAKTRFTKTHKITDADLDEYYKRYHHQLEWMAVVVRSPTSPKLLKRLGIDNVPVANCS